MPRLTKSKNHNLRSDIACGICSQKTTQPRYDYAYDNGASQILQCKSCGHLFIWPIPLKELEKRTMDSIPDAELFGSTILKTIYEKIVIRREIKAVRKFISTPNPHVLDIGCGTGWTTSIWQKNGFIVTGLEPSQSRSDIARKTYGISIVHDHIEHFKPSEKFDVIIMRHLLEHIENPVFTLIAVKSFLKPNGISLIIIPNINCIGRYIFKENWEWVLPWHLHFYTPRTLRRLLEKTGYQKLKTYQMPSPLWYPHTLNKALFGENSRFNPNFIPPLAGQNSPKGLNQTRLQRVGSGLIPLFCPAKEGAKSGIKFPQWLSLSLCIPLIVLGMFLNLNDNMTLLFRNKG